MIKLVLPLHVDLPRRKKPKRVYANMNGYKNLPHKMNSSVKDIYKAMVWEQLKDEREVLPTPVHVIITLYTVDKEERDLANICPVIQKYVDDAVVEYGLLKDDNVKYLKRVTYIYGGVDRNHPRCEIEYAGLK